MKIIATCVRWRKCATQLRIGLLIILGLAVGSHAIGISAQSNDPSSLPLLGFQDLHYLGGFRVPSDVINGHHFGYGGKALAFRPDTNSLFVATAGKTVAEISIPEPVNSSHMHALPVASLLQPFADPAEGHIADIDSSGAYLDNLMVYGNRLYGTGLIYYDANNTQTVSHFARSLQLDQSSFSGWSRVWQKGKAGFVAGMMAPVPTEWREKLGGPAVTGQCCVPIVTRTSFGPAAVAFDPAHVGLPEVAGTGLLYYPSDHPTLGEWGSSNPTYGGTTLVGGMAMIAGTRTLLYFGSNGEGEHCYGEGTANKTLADQSGGHICYDPTSSDKGSHAYPYRYQIWAYDLNELAAVKAGHKQPWEVVPYGVWPIEFPIPEPKVRIGGVAYDSERQLIYVSQLRVDQAGGYLPIIHVFKVAAVPGSLPPSSNTAGSLTMSADRTAPQAAQTRITFTASPMGGVAPHQYQWWIYDGAAWNRAQDWSGSNKFAWTPVTANANYHVGARVRSAGNVANLPEATAAMPFAIVTPNGPPTARVSGVTLTANKNAPQAPGTTVVWAANPVGGVGPHQYKWHVYDGANWNVVVNWSQAPTYTWKPSAVNARYRVAVWVRSAGNTNDYHEMSAEHGFPIEVPGPVIAPVTSVQLVADRVAPQALGTAVTWTATSAGGVGPHQYKWFVFDGSNWNVVRNWSTSHTFTWTPSSANNRYRVAVWVRSAGSTNDYFQASAEHGFAITPK